MEGNREAERERHCDKEREVEGEKRPVNAKVRPELRAGQLGIITDCASS